jgi:hypothetical protein
MLTRIYGTAFFDAAELDAHLEHIEEARRRDHRRLGRELDLFHLSETSPGSPFWHPRGMVLFNELGRLWRELNASRGYEEVKTPILFGTDLWKRSGHWDNYRDKMFLTEQVEGRQFGLKPMNCPGHVEIYNHRRHSYRDLPLRLAEQGLVHRHERRPNLRSQDQDMPDIEGPSAVDFLFQRAAPQKIHPESGASIPHIAAVNGNDVGVADFCRNTAFLEQQDFIFASVLGAQKLDRDFPLELDVPRSIQLGPLSRRKALEEEKIAPAFRQIALERCTALLQTSTESGNAGHIAERVQKQSIRSGHSFLGGLPIHWSAVGN